MRPLVAAWRRGEGTQSEIAARHGMPTPTFAWWCRRIGAGSSAAPAFVAIDVEPGIAGGSTAPFEVRLRGGREVRVPPEFDAGALSRLLAVIDGAC